MEFARRVGTIDTPVSMFRGVSRNTDLKEANGDSAAAYVIEEQWARDVEHV